jgi:hypothetical protein
MSYILLRFAMANMSIRVNHVVVEMPDGLLELAPPARLRIAASGVRNHVSIALSEADMVAPITVVDSIEICLEMVAGAPAAMTDAAARSLPPRAAEVATEALETQPAAQQVARASAGTSAELIDFDPDACFE